MKKFMWIILALTVTSLLARRHDEDENVKLFQKLQNARQILEGEQMELKRITDSRWTVRQKQVEKKTYYQKEIQEVKADIERLYIEISRIREEMLLQESRASENNQKLEKEKEQYLWFRKAVESVIEKQEDAARRGFPIGQQNRTLDLQNASLNGNKNLTVSSRLKILQNHVLSLLKKQRSVELSKETVVLADNTIDEAEVMRFGNVFAVGVNDTGKGYYLGYTGNNGSNPFEWVVLTDKAALGNLNSGMLKWMSEEKIEGEIFIDAMQNKFSNDLLGVERDNLQKKIADFIRAGGVIMIPLCLILLWAIILMINRVVVYSLAHSRDDKFIDRAVEFLNDKELKEAKSFASRSRGVLARILNTCLDHSKWRRPVAEKAVKELLLDEIPALDKHLDTLAVLAGAAPLLGLLGTVTGMIAMFESITRFGTGDPKLLAGGISEALVTTEVGLAIAIPVLLVHNFLRNRRNHIQADMEMYAMRILNRLWPEE